MRVLVTSAIPTFSYKEEIILPHEDSNDISVSLLTEIQENLRDELWDFYSDILSGCPAKPVGTFSTEDTFAFFYGWVEETISKNKGIWIADCILYDDEGCVKNSFIVDISDILLEMLEADSCTGEFDCRLGSYVERCLFAFVEQSKWHIEKDLLWFGIDGATPERAWSINKQTTKEELLIWFDQDSYEFMKLIGDFEENFLFWYIFECGNDVPDMEKIRKACPVQIFETDDVPDVLARLSLY